MAGSSMESEALVEVVAAAIKHMRQEFNNGDPSPVETLVAAVQKSPEDAPAPPIAAIVEGIISAGKPPPAEGVVDDVLEEAILRARLEMKRYSRRGNTALETFRNGVEVCDNALDFITKYALFKQAILAHVDREEPEEESLVEEKLRESLMGVVDRIRSNDFVGRSDLSVAGLVGTLLLKTEDHEPAARHALVERLIQSSRVPLSQSAIEAIYTNSFTVAIKQVREMTILLETSPGEALVAAVGRSTEKPLTKEVCKKAIACSIKAFEAEMYLQEKEAFKDTITDAFDDVTEQNFLDCPLGHFVHLMTTQQNSNLMEENLINQLIFCSKPASAQRSAMMHACIRLLARHSNLPPSDQINYSQPKLEDEEDVQQVLDFFNSSTILYGDWTPPKLSSLSSVPILSNETRSMEESADVVFWEAIKAAIQRLQPPPPSSLSPKEGLVFSVDQHMPRFSPQHKWELIKQIILAGKSSPEDIDSVDEALKEAIVSAISKIKQAKSSGDSGDPRIPIFFLLLGQRATFLENFIKFLVEGVIDESGADLRMKHAIIKRVLFACKPTQPEYSGKQILTAAFMAAISQLQEELVSPKSALEAAIERSTFPPLMKHLLTELVSSVPVYSARRTAKRSSWSKFSSLKWGCFSLPELPLSPKDDDLGWPHIVTRRTATCCESSGVPRGNVLGVGNLSPTTSNAPVQLPPPSKFKVKQKFKVLK